MTAPTTGLLRRLTAGGAALVLLGLGLAVPAAAAAPTQGLATVVKPQDTGYRSTHAVTRTFTDASGKTSTVSSYDVTVAVDQTTDLRGRQRVRVSWSGAQPSGGRAINPYGENGLQQEYPVVVLQCRGTDDASLPAAEQLSQRTCWTASRAQRSQVNTSAGEATWVHDAYADNADQQRVSGLDGVPPEQCPGVDVDPYFTHLTPFDAANGTVYPACSADQMPPEAAVGAAFPPAELAAFTDEDGKGSVQFEVRSDVENESLGCNHETACSIVVVPIAGISCDQPSSPQTIGDKACRKTGRFAPGSSNFAAEGADQAVSPALWWSASNWRNRFSVPITFGLPPDACDVLDTRPPTGFYGSELLAQAALQWSPAYCLDKQRFKFQLNQMSDGAGFDLMETGQGPAAVVSSEHDNTGADPVGYAPTAVTGFGIGYIIDRPDNAGEYTKLKLNPRLIAKLLFQSYVGSDLGRGHPGLADNPVAIMSDPEFIKLNPGLSQTNQEVGATLLSLSNSSDIIEQLTEYIAQDADAMAFVRGKADPWGMVVNPRYKNITLPVSEIPLLDTYVPETQSACRQANPGVYFNQLAAPVTTLRKISEALIDAWPNVQTRCDFDPATGLYKTGRVDRQGFGSRFMLGLVSLGDAERYGLHTAALETKPGRYVAASDATMGAAVQLMKQKKPLAPFTLDERAVTRASTRGDAYPGTMVIYTAAKLHGLDQATADQLAQFVRISTTEGQELGSGNGQLPAGYLPIRATGPTAKLLTAADLVGARIAAQKAPGSGTGDDQGEDDGEADGGGDGNDDGGSTTPGGTDPGVIDTPGLVDPGTVDAPGSEEPGTTDGDQPAVSTDPVLTTASPGTTASPTSGLMGKLFPALLGLVVLSGLYTLGSRFFVRPPRGGLGSGA